MLKVAKVVLINKNNEILLGLRSKESPTSPNKWSLFGGQVEEGETFEQAAIREVKEETGITITKPKQFHKITSDRERAWFVAKINTPVEEVKLTEEVDCGYFSYEEAKKLDLSPNTRKALEKYFNS